MQLPLYTMANAIDCSVSNGTDSSDPNEIATRPLSRCNPSRIYDTLTSSISYTFQIYITIKGNIFFTQIDSGSWFGAWPYGKLSGYTGPAISSTSYSIPSGSPTVSQVYGDGSSWSGYSVTVPVALNGTSIASNAQIALITSNTGFLDSNAFQGILGLGMDGDQYVGTPSVVDAWFSAGVMPANRIALHGCPLAHASEGYIDFGDETAYSDCGGEVYKVQMPPASGYYEVNFTSFAVGGVVTGMGTGWQSSQLSILDSGTSMLLIPGAALSALQLAVFNSKGLSGSNSDVNGYLYNGNLISSSKIT
ncbi:Type I transmembrane sorting receptor, partial [Kappamyces sp. JEL0680]